MSNLLKCPFCGETAEVCRTPKYWVVQCDDCEAETCGETEEDAVKRWNRRALPQELKEAYQICLEAIVDDDPVPFLYELFYAVGKIVEGEV